LLAIALLPTALLPTALLPTALLPRPAGQPADYGHDSGRRARVARASDSARINMALVTSAPAPRIDAGCSEVAGFVYCLDDVGNH
jgi:hypothetical protein